MGEKAKDAVEPTPADEQKGLAGNTAYSAAFQKLDKLPDARIGMTVIKLQGLQPRLQQCIIHAKV